MSKEARADLSEAQKKAVIDEHGLIIQAGLDRVNAILPKSAQMKIEQYKQILLSGKIEGFP